MIKNESKIFDVSIIGAGVSGLMCARLLEQSGLRVCLIDMENKAGRKLLISGGGHCNFTNTNISPKNYHSDTENFVDYALEMFGPKQTLNYVRSKKIQTYQKVKGRYFCQNSALDIWKALVNDCVRLNISWKMGKKVTDVSFDDGIYSVFSDDNLIALSRNLVVASGGISYPKLGVSSIADNIAKKFKMKIVKKFPVLNAFLTKEFSHLSGISLNAEISINNHIINGEILFSHRSISGPAVFNASVYMPADVVYFNFVPGIGLSNKLVSVKDSKKKLKNILSDYMPSRLAEYLSGDLGNQNIAEIGSKSLNELVNKIQSYELKPILDGYDYAEVTKGGVSCDFINSETMESKTQRGLFFIGECMDVVGDLGGYNIQWAFSSASLCASTIINVVNGEI